MYTVHLGQKGSSAKTILSEISCIQIVVTVVDCVVQIVMMMLLLLWRRKLQLLLLPQFLQYHRQLHRHHQILHPHRHTPGQHEDCSCAYYTHLESICTYDTFVRTTMINTTTRKKTKRRRYHHHHQINILVENIREQNSSRRRFPEMEIVFSNQLQYIGQTVITESLEDMS